MQQEIILKKNIIGGFDRKQVTQCLLELKSEYNKCLSTKDIDDIKNNIERLTSILNNKKEQIQLLHKQIESLNKSDCEDDRSTVSKSISAAEKNIKQAKATAEAINQNTKNIIENKSAQIERMLLKIHSINEETEKIKSVLTQILVRLSEIQIDTDIEEPDSQAENVQIKANDETIIVQEETVSKAEPENIFERYEEDISLTSEDTEENINSIDNFFNELYKMTNGKLFEQRPLPKSDTDDDFEYEY